MQLQKSWQFLKEEGSYFRAPYIYIHYIASYMQLMIWLIISVLFIKMQCKDLSSKQPL